jgi:hypothetical protein
VDRVLRVCWSGSDRWQRKSAKPQIHLDSENLLDLWLSMVLSKRPHKRGARRHNSVMKISLLRRAIFATLIALIIAAPTRAGSGSKPTVLTPILGNYPDTFLSLSTNTTVTPDAAPMNTTRITVSTSTNFNGRLEGYPTTGVVRVTDAHPAGTYTVTVEAFDSGGASETKTFMLTVTTPATCNPVRFAASNFVAGTNHPTSLAVGDFNGDGNQDLAVANYSSNNVSILLGDGAGNFSAAGNFAAGDGPNCVAVGDFNGDGKQDLAVANNGTSFQNPSNVSILLGDGTGSFSAPTNFNVGRVPQSIAVGDFNGDGKQDLAVANSESANVSILLGNGDGTFSPAPNVSVGVSPFSVAVGDFNGDGHQDLAVANLTGTVSILLGDGAGHFSAATNFDAGSVPESVAVGDFNGDGKQDLVVANFDSNSVSILLGDGGGNFSAPTNFGAGTSPFSVAVGDFNGDGRQDLAVANYGSNNVSILSGDGTGNFSAATNFGAGINPLSVAVGDFNGDGKQDLAAVNLNSSNVSTLLRVCNLTPTNAASRKTHGSAGTFDINMPLTGSSGVECRSGGATHDYSLVATFSGNVNVTGMPQSQVITGSGCVGSGGVCDPNGTVSFSGNIVTVPLTNIADAQVINVQINGVNGASDEPAVNVTIPMGFLIGDVTGNRTVNASDVSQTKSQAGMAVSSSNFREDVNANGTISSTDVAIVKSEVGTALPP